MAWVMIESTNQEFFDDEYYVDEGGSPVAIVNGGANARLIVAAAETAKQRDELLAFAEAFVRGYWKDGAGARAQLFKQASAAIAKAKGEV